MPTAPVGAAHALRAHPRGFLYAREHAHELTGPSVLHLHKRNAGRRSRPGRVVDMSRQVFLYDPPERFVAGTVGQPGDRTFFLQASEGARVTSVALEKTQVNVLAQRVEELLDEVSQQRSGDMAVPATPPTELTDERPLQQPILEEFRVGTLALAWDPEGERVVVEAQAATEEDEEETEPLSDEDEGPDVLRVRISPAMARAFAHRATEVVNAGRPNCPLCSLPLDPEGHICPRQNGHRDSVPKV